MRPQLSSCKLLPSCTVHLARHQAGAQMSQSRHQTDGVNDVAQLTVRYLTTTKVFSCNFKTSQVIVLRVPSTCQHKRKADLLSTHIFVLSPFQLVETCCYSPSTRILPALRCPVPAVELIWAMCSRMGPNRPERDTASTRRPFDLKSKTNQHSVIQSRLTLISRQPVRYRVHQQVAPSS